jgi:hypothetical protein
MKYAGTLENGVAFSIESDGPLTASDQSIIQELSLLPNINRGRNENEDDSDKTLSEEGSKGSNHIPYKRRWPKFENKILEFKLRKLSLYNKTVCDLKMNSNQLYGIENKLFKSITEMLNQNWIHTYIQRTELGECDFGGSETGRLLYWADNDPPFIYFAYVFRRDKMGHISEELAQKVMRLVLEEKRKVREEILWEDLNVKGKKN